MNTIEILGQLKTFVPEHTTAYLVIKQYQTTIEQAADALEATIIALKQTIPHHSGLCVKNKHVTRESCKCGAQIKRHRDLLNLW